MNCSPEKYIFIQLIIEKNYLYKCYQRVKLVKSSNLKTLRRQREFCFFIENSVYWAKNAINHFCGNTITAIMRMVIEHIIKRLWDAERAFPMTLYLVGVIIVAKNDYCDSIDIAGGAIAIHLLLWTTIAILM